MYFISALKDEPDITLRPRLEAMEADVSRVRFLASKFFPLDDENVDKLRSEIERTRPVLIVFDTLFSFMPTSTDTNKPTDVRAVLSKIATLASEFGCAVILIRHWTKGERGGKAIYRGGGSIDIIGIARSAIAVGIHPEYPRFMCHGPREAQLIGYGREPGCFRLQRKGKIFLSLNGWAWSISQPTS